LTTSIKKLRIFHQKIANYLASTEIFFRPNNYHLCGQSQTSFRLGTTSFDRRPKWSHNFRFAIFTCRLCKKNQSESDRKQVGSPSV